MNEYSASVRSRTVKSDFVFARGDSSSRKSRSYAHHFGKLRCLAIASFIFWMSALTSPSRSAASASSRSRKDAGSIRATSMSRRRRGRTPYH